MKKFYTLCCAATLIFGVSAFSVSAAPPVDNDGDGVKSNQDCNDNDPAVWDLNSCGLCEPEANCSGGGQPEVCTDGVDNDLDGLTDCADSDCAADPACSTNNPSRDVVVMATNDLGMHCACPGAEYFLLLPPFNTLRAQVIERGFSSPVLLDDPTDIRVEYNIVENTDASLQADPYYSTWIQMMPKYGFGPAIDPADGKIQGLTGAKLDGEMHAQTGEGWWEIVGVPAFPDASNLSAPADKIMTDPLGGPNRNPYLTGNIKVYDQATDELLAETNTVVPVAFGGCCSCHLQLTADNGLEPTPLNSFTLMGQLHERDSGINFAALDPDGDGAPGPVRCSVCHWDPAMGEAAAPGGYNDPTTGAPLPTSQYSFSDVLHRWHVENAMVLTYDPDLATNCYACHPGNGVNCYRGHHTSKVVDPRKNPNPIWCSDCHGDLYQRVAEGQLQNPWSDATLPKCEDCHRNTGEGGGYLHTGIFGSYLNSRGHKNAKVLCSTCHGAPHALYPSTLAKDNEQNINLQGLANPIGVCDTCHTGKSSKYGTPMH